ncbi:MAG: glucosaminidase domain-containing protein [Clostridiales bacterium]|jgi:hypothetical protein|nr:glucosaminidase domain-containing protein [Clostridiales bacterium]
MRAGVDTPIMGRNVLTVRQLEAFLLSRERSPRINCTPFELAEYFITESEIEGVRGDIAFMQAIHETGWFRFGGQVLPEQNNFGGIGAVNHSPVRRSAFEAVKVQMAKDFNGYNYSVLAAKYGHTERHIRRILATQGRRHQVDENQISLYDAFDDGAR